MQRRDFLAAKERIRYAAKTRACRDGAIESDAGSAEARTRESQEPGKTLREAGNRLGAFDRSFVQSEFDGARCRSCAERARRARESARRSHCGDAQLC